MGVIMANTPPGDAESININTPMQNSTCIHEHHFYNETTIIVDNSTHISEVHSEGFGAFPLREFRSCGFKAKKWTISGQSMHPLVIDGHVWIEPVKWKNIKVGDVVVIERDGGDLLHALIYKNDAYAISQGYNNAVRDNFEVTPEMVNWRYCNK